MYKNGFGIKKTDKGRYAIKPKQEPGGSGKVK